MKRRAVIQSLTALTSIGLAGTSLVVRAQEKTKIAFGYSAVGDFASVFVAKEEGFFDKRGLDVELKFIPLNSNIPAAVQSDSLQLGGPTPTIFLQSVDGGLDHVVVGGGGVLSKTYTDLGLVARAGSGIKKPADCVGKKIGVPGLNALLHVTFRQWLKINGVDYKKVTFIETPFPQHADLIRGGSLDAVVTGGPFMARIVDSATGYVAAYYTTFLPDGQPTILYVGKRDWVAKNAKVTKSFQDAVIEGAAFVKNPKNDEKLRTALAKHLRLPPPAVAKMQISPPGPIITEKQLQWWVALMKEQEMLKTTINTATLIVK